MDLESFVERFAVERRGTNCLKWDALQERFGDPDLFPMWVADMEFSSPPQILQALRERVDHGAFGYGIPDDSYFEAFDAWAVRHHEARVERDWVRFATGVVNGFHWMVNAFTEPGDAVLLATPVYYPMHAAVRNSGRKLVTTQLVCDESGVYRYDLDDMEKVIAENDVKLFIACSPHNPVGRVWTEQELEQVLQLCERHGVLVVSDEIHQDIIVGDRTFVAAQEVAGGKYAGNLVTLNAVSKTFNLAGLIHSHIIIPDAGLRARYDRWAKGVVQTELNILGATAAKAGWLYGDEWLDGLLSVVRRNDAEFRARLGEFTPHIVIPELEGSYLLWVDLRGHLDPAHVQEFMTKTCRLAVDYGEWFGQQCRGFVRFNVATTPANVDHGLDLLTAGLAGLH
ncbi:cystathione beta-lyase [Propionibacterium cyclohexanicum]|uniref:cysteine-S-conjugate beta-lyase n=1 Tax=Propionibacterium cyclohexanicum TaxID=64702 RepID=A0A1H9RLJ6_9ACTN|nr:MalY/PatB family protein [Propionibacterium cyclohexanicum]SER73642.1 cystathione beta-lyase [Propionibacterium cyclohexanicum]